MKFSKFTKWLQEQLKAHGHRPGPIDGLFGEKTLAALKAFQKAKGLPVSGMATRGTVKALKADPATGKASKAAKKTAAKKVAKKVVAKPAVAAGFKLDARAERNLKGVHRDLVKVVRRAAEISDVDFTITQGLRTLAEQRRLVAKGASQTMNSRHLTGHAVDVAAKVGSKIRWDWPLYSKIAKAFKKAARELGIPITWGGDWRTIKDGPHFQLSWRKYPK